MNGFQYKHGDRPLEGYTIQRAVGRGGFGEVYFAISDSGREVALKAIQGYEQIELRGVSQCMNLKSPHLVTIFDVKHNDEDKPFVIMEYVAGPSLKDLLEQSPSGLGPQKTAFFLREIAKGLSYLHERGIVHRDLKPGNIFYEDGYVKIGDYGLSKAMSASRYSGQTITVGTVHYMAPEIGQGRYDCGVDIYALGCCLYEMLTGNVPYFGSSHGEILMKHLMAEPDLGGIEEPFATAIKRSLAKDPNDRFKSAQELVEAVFGAEHVRNSVSCFSPDSLSLVAARAVQKVAVGGPGSSADAVRLGPQPPVPPVPPPGTAGDPWVNLAQRMDRVGQRIGDWRGRVNERMDQLRGRLGAHGGETSAAADNQPQDLPEITSDEVIFSDLRRDPLDRRQRVVLMLITTAAVGIGAGLLGGSSLGSVEGALWMAPIVICWATAGLGLARKVFGSRLGLETGIFPHLIYGGLACLLALPGLGIFALIADGTNADRRIDEDTMLGTLGAVGIALLLVNWRERTCPGRKERVGLGEAFVAGTCAAIIALIFGGAALLAGGILAGISMAAQVASPFDPQAFRRPKRAGERWGHWRPQHLQAQAAAVGNPAQAPVVGEGAMPPEGPRPPRVQVGRALRQPGANWSAHGRWVLPGWARAIFLSLFVIFAGTGIMLLSYLGMTHVSDRFEEAMFISFGVGSLVFALFCLSRATRRSYRGIWSSIIKPLGMLVCAQSAFVAGTVIGNANLRDDETLVALAFIVFPGILFVILAFISQSMVNSSLAEIGLAAIPPAYHRALPASDRKRGLAIVLAAVGFFPLCPIAGLHRIYAGKIGTGIVWFLTLGLLGFGTVFDILMLLLGRFQDSEGKWVICWDGVTVPPVPEGPPAMPAAAAMPVVGMAPANLAQAVTGSIPGIDVASPAAAFTAGDSGASSMRWNPPARPLVIRNTNGLLNALGLLIVLAAVIVGLMTTLLPTVVAAGIPDRSLAEEMRRHFGYDRWPTLVGKLGTLATSAVMVLGIVVMLIARRRAGAAHTGRAVLGVIALSMWIGAMWASVNDIDWSKVVLLSDENSAGAAIEFVMDRLFPPRLVAAALSLLAGVALLVWPERRVVIHPADGSQGGSLS